MCQHALSDTQHLTVDKATFRINKTEAGVSIRGISQKYDFILLRIATVLCHGDPLCSHTVAELLVKCGTAACGR